MPMFIQQRPQCIHIGRTLMNQSFSATKDRCTRLLLNGLGCNETHLGLAGCDDNRFGISRIIFLTLYERANILRRNQFYLMANCFSSHAPSNLRRHMLQK